jgi:hypothetical protein
MDATEILDMQQVAMEEMPDAFILTTTSQVSDGRGGAVDSPGISTAPIPCRYQSRISMRGLQLVAGRPTSKNHGTLITVYDEMVPLNGEINLQSTVFTGLASILDVEYWSDQVLMHILIEHDFA